MSIPVVAVVGVGPGLGEALARRFHAGGWRPALVSRSLDTTGPLAKELGGGAFACDVTDGDAVRGTLERIRTTMGPVHTLLWNVGSGVFGDIDQVDEAALDLAYQTNCRGLFTAARAVVGDMRTQGSGKILITGATASRRGKPFTTAFAAGKAAQRSLAQSLARSLWPQGIHVALVIVDGMIDLPRTRARMPDATDEAFLSPDHIAETYMSLARQPRSAWTFELEVRPHVESW